MFRVIQNGVTVDVPREVESAGSVAIAAYVAKAAPPKKSAADKPTRDVAAEDTAKPVA